MSRDSNILPVKYEDIIAAPKEAVKTLFGSLEIVGIQVNHAVTSMERDSQRDRCESRQIGVTQAYIKIGYDKD